MNARMEVLRNILQGLRELQDDLIAQGTSLQLLNNMLIFNYT